MDILNKENDYRSMNMMLEYLAGYGLDHHSRAMFKVMPELIERELPNLCDYISSRQVQTNATKKIKKGKIKEGDP